MDATVSEEDLWEAYWADRSDANRNRLADHYYEFVVRIAEIRHSRLSPASMVYRDDLVSYGIVALMSCVERFSPARNVKFETFAGPRIHGAMLDGIREMDWLKPLRRAHGWKGRQVPKCRHISTYEREAESGQGVLQPIEAVAFTVDIDRLELQDKVKLALRGLSKTEKIIVTEYYMRGQTMKAIGKSLGIHESRVSQIMKDIKRRIRERWPDGVDDQ